ncbi:beta-ketoacyl-ACP synthase III [Leptospirillum ferrooxidans]|jgi:3-oxoacyl-[acyl-carrier-protein] synthase-3|uniref:Beta-ketoacyl-[acyl-carrier-protein] synthase III n=1 Tax=Leptospirillum ferrooxidans (strain C2-3) TaxID=1162668 RepID=I0IQR6_LEPFC|nr:beta-ketoacyl-ACP synthase III [Leptospirillum ferrooxidans]BAM07615.1 putative 3-oxoacyl-[acyl-carrier-protein] synthase III [Leptospirillum ferrooxidans C2-3]
MDPLVSIVSGTGSYAPDRIMTNFDLESIVETSDSWIRERTGIGERRIAAPGQATSDLAVLAGKKALEMAGISGADLDGIIVATTTPDMPFPSTACLVQRDLGAGKAFAFDLNAVCSGFVYALKVADSMIKSGSAQKILVIGAEVMSRYLDWEDRTTCVLFGDGAGALVLSASSDPRSRGVGKMALHADGAGWEMIYVPGGGSRLPASSEVVAQNLTKIRMKGAETFKMAVRTIESSIREVLALEGLTPSDIDWVIPHQANGRILGAVGQRLGISEDRFCLNIERYGNTSAASIPVALDEAVRSGRIAKGDRVVVTAFGAGVTWGSGLLTWEMDRFSPEDSK